MYDYIIAGGGLAGSSIAMMLSRQSRVLLVHQETPGSEGSAITAGLVNPIMTRQGARVWRAEEALESLQVIVELSSARKHIRMEGLYRPAISDKQIDSFRAVSTQHPGLSDWVTAEEMKMLFPDVCAPRGALHVTAGGAAQIPEYVRSLQAAVINNGATIRRDLVESVTKGSKSCRVHLRSGRSIESRVVILAVGAGFERFPRLAALNLHRIKGQIVIMKRPNGLHPVPLLSGSGYVVDQGDTIVAGSSYHHEFEDTGVDRAVLQTLVAKASGMVPALKDAVIVGGQAGIRVTVPGTYLPMVGPLDDDERIWVATGLGSKGLLMSAWIADRIEAFINGQLEVPVELAVKHKT